MNKAQKRAWLNFSVSCLTILIAAAVFIFISLKQIDICARTGTFGLLVIVCAIPLTLIFLISRRFPGKDYDERDILIEHKATPLGMIGAFVFLGTAAFTVVSTRMNSLRASFIIFLIYLACFVWILVSSAAALIQYGRGDKGEKS